jgi:hypothetical protein
MSSRQTPETQLCGARARGSSHCRSSRWGLSSEQSGVATMRTCGTPGFTRRVTARLPRTWAPALVQTLDRWRAEDVDACIGA